MKLERAEAVTHTKLGHIGRKKKISISDCNIPLYSLKLLGRL